MGEAWSQLWIFHVLHLYHEIFEGPTYIYLGKGYLMAGVVSSRQPKLMFVPNFVTQGERDELKNIAEAYFKEGILEPNPGGPKRFRVKMNGNKHEHCTPFISLIADRIISRFNLNGCPVDEYLGWVISLIQPGGCLPPHIDSFDHYGRDTRRHLRCNIMVSRENDTYNPIIEANAIAVPECSLWSFFASESKHGTQPVVGDSDRIVYQFGFSVPSDFVLSDADDQGQFWFS